MKKLITNNWLLITILFLAAVLRFYRLDNYPALNADEAAIGYNAYSLIQTGKDEHGHPWPIHFQSFNDFKPGLYFYLVLPFIKVLGLNQWAVRIPGATLGVLTVLVLYFLIKEFFPEEKMEVGRWKLEIIASAMLAISPWHIHFSRGGWEVNAATFFITAGLLFFLKALRSSKDYTLCVLFFVLAVYSYHAARIIVPLLGFGLVTIYRKELSRNVKPVIIAGVLGVFLLLPLAIDLTRGSVFSRVAGVGLFADPGPINRINEQRGEHPDFRTLVPRLLHNKGVNYGLAFAKNWLDHFHGEFLFLSGDAIQRNKVPETGQMYMIDILFLLIGIIFLIKSKILNPKSKLLIFWWLVVAPTAAALTFQSPHALRSHNMIIPLEIVSAFGLFTTISWLKSRGVVSSPPSRWKRIYTSGMAVLVLVVAWNFARYLHLYYIHMAKESPFSSQYGVLELVDYVRENQEKYQRIVVTDRYDQPYVLFLFYLKYPPGKFQENHLLISRDKFGFSTVGDFDKFHFKEIDFDKIRPENPKSLIVGTDEEIPEEANIVKEIYGSNDYKYFQIVAN